MANNSAGISFSGIPFSGISFSGISFSRRTRLTPFSQKVENAGAKSYTIYNHMRIPTVFQGLEEDYHHLKKYVQVWDVSAQRQVQIQGKDAAVLVQKMTPRSLKKMKVGRCYYAPLINSEGGIINDPVVLKIAENCYWLSLADSDILLWTAGLAEGFGMDVNLSEPAIFPLAVQGPKAEDLMASVFGEVVRKIGFFRFQHLPFQDTSFIVARSGWSKQGGFEIYLSDWKLGETLWDVLFEAGQSMNVRAGCPNHIERIEGGLLSYGNDMSPENTPYECGMAKICDAETMQSCIGGNALQKRTLQKPQQEIRGFFIEGKPVPNCSFAWQVFAENRRVGQITSAVWSPDFKNNIAIGMIQDSHWENGTCVVVRAPDGDRQAKVCSLPFVK